MKLISKIKEDWRKYSEDNSERKATVSEGIHNAYGVIIMIFVILCILEFITYTNNKYFKEEPIKPYNIEVIYFNGDKDTIKNIKSDPYFDRTDRFKNDSDFNLGGVRSFKKIK